MVMMICLMLIVGNDDDSWIDGDDWIDDGGDNLKDLMTTIQHIWQQMTNIGVMVTTIGVN